MAVTAKFSADFSSFSDAVQKADIELRGFEGRAGEVSKSLSRMVDSFTGRKIISEAALAAEAVERIGGVANLTQQELARVSAIATEAAAKLRAMGQDVPERIQKLADAAKNAAPEVDKLQGSFSKVDSILASLGIHIGPEIKGLGELGSAAGKTASQIGLLATAGLVAAAAIGGWKIGRWIADLTGADTAIANSAAKFMGWGDVVAQTAGAKADVLALATQRAGREITNMSDALAVNADWLKKNQAAAKEAADSLERWNDAMKELNSVGDGWRGTLETINGEVVAAIKYYLEAGVSQKALADAFQLTAAQVRSVASALDADRAAVEAWGEALHTAFAAIDQLQDTVFKRRIELMKANDGEEAKRIEQLKITNAAVIAEFEAEQKLSGAYAVSESALQKYTAALTALHLKKVEGISQTSQEKVIEDEFTKSLYDEAVAQDKARDALAGHNAELAKVPALARAAAEGLAGYAVVQNGVMRDLFGRPVAGSLSNPGLARAGGGPVSAGQPYMVGEKGPELFVPSSSGSIVPNGGMTIALHVDARGASFEDDRALERLSEKVAQRISARLR